MYDVSKTVQVLRMEVDERTSPSLLYAFSQLAESMAGCYQAGSLSLVTGYREISVVRERSDEEVATLRDTMARHAPAPRTEPAEPLPTRVPDADPEHESMNVGMGDYGTPDEL